MKKKNCNLFFLPFSPILPVMNVLVLINAISEFYVSIFYSDDF